MQRLLRLLQVIILSSLLPHPVLAAPAEDACAALMEARANLVQMIATTDRSAHDGYKAKVHEASARLDRILNEMAAGYNSDDKARSATFKPVWEDFKKTREGEIIPLVYAGKNAEAKAIATGIQAERMGKMRAAMGCK